MKKFKEGEIFYNTIKAHPKVEFFANSGIVRYNRQNNPVGSSNINNDSITLSDLINPVYAGLTSNGVVIPPSVDGALLAENADFLLTESGDNLATES